MKYDKPKGQRINRYFHGINVDDYWWIPSLKIWSKTPFEGEHKGLTAQSYRPCRTLKAFRRHLRKNPEIREQATLISEYVGYDING